MNRWNLRMQEVTSIGAVSISAGWENNYPILLLTNHGKIAESIDFLYLEHRRGPSESWKQLHLPFGQQLKVELPPNFERWHKFGFHIRDKRVLASVSELKKLLEDAKKQIQIEPPQPESEHPISEPKQIQETKDLTDRIQKSYVEMQHLTEQHSIDYQKEAKITLQETCEKIRELACVYKNGEAIDFVNIKNPTPSQNVPLILNLIGNTIRKWKDELEQHNETNPDLIDTLTYSEQCIKEKLKVIRGDITPMPDPLELQTDVNTDAELNEIQDKCSNYVAWFEGRLFGYEERVKISNLEEYNQFIPQFIKDRLFNGTVRFFQSEKMPKQLGELLDLIGYEVVPIEMGKTQADARIHDIHTSRQTSGESGTVVEVILPGLRRIADGEIVQKPVVIRGE